MPLLKCSNVEQLRQELSRNRDLRKICGFNDYDYYFGKNKLVPPPKTILICLKMIEPMLKDYFNGKDVEEDGKMFLSKTKRLNKDGDENYFSLHWALLQVQKPSFGGGKVIFDDKIIMKNGIINKSIGGIR